MVQSLVQYFFYPSNSTSTITELNFSKAFNLFDKYIDPGFQFKGGTLIQGYEGKISKSIATTTYVLAKVN